MELALPGTYESTVAGRLERLPLSRFHRRFVTLVSLGGWFDFFDIFMVAYLGAALRGSGFLTLAELSLYLPLGNPEPPFLLARLGLTVGIAVAALVLAMGWTRSGAVLGVALVAGYAVLVPWPRSGLPRQYDAEMPPAFMRWLADHESTDDRSFGIMPEWSSVAMLRPRC